MQQVSLLANSDKLQKFLSTGEGFTSGRATTYGLSKENIDAIKGLDVNNIDKWTRRQRDTYATILNRMNQDIVLDKTIGSSSIWGSTTTTGRIVHTLVQYPLMMHNVHFQNGMRQMDRQLLLDHAFAFAGSYLGLQTKYALLDKDVDDDKVAMYSIMNMPIMSGLGAITSMSSPALFEMVEGISSLGDPVEIERNW